MHLKSFPEHSLTGYFLPFHYNHNTDSLVAKKKTKTQPKKPNQKNPPKTKKPTNHKTTTNKKPKSPKHVSKVSNKKSTKWNKMFPSPFLHSERWFHQGILLKHLSTLILFPYLWQEGLSWWEKEQPKKAWEGKKLI